MKTLTITLLLALSLFTACKKEIEVAGQINIQNITDSSALVKFSGATVNAKEISEWGVAYGTESYPERSGKSIRVYTGTNSYSGEELIEHLDDTATYNLRVYATTDQGTYYDNKVFNFKTAEKPPVANQVGDIGPAGGIVFYSDGQGGGLEMVNINQIGSWGCLSPSLPSCVNTFGYGASNTQQILNACPSTSSAPAVCNAFAYGGYDDWYLPSYQELVLIYQNLHVTGLISLSSGSYISSSQSTVSNSYCTGLYTTNGSAGTILKNSNNHFCPVRTIQP